MGEGSQWKWGNLGADGEQRGYIKKQRVDCGGKGETRDEG